LLSNSSTSGEWYKRRYREKGFTRKSTPSQPLDNGREREDWIDVMEGGPCKGQPTPGSAMG